MTRRQLIESCVAAGYTVTHRKNGERVLMAPNGSWFDTAAITKFGLDYAAELIKRGKEV